MFREKCFREVDEIRNGPVVGISPIACEFEAMAGLFRGFFRVAGRLANVLVARGVRVVLGMCAVGDDEDLHILEKPGFRPEAVALVAPDLVEGFLQQDAAALELDMNQRESVNKDRDIVAVLICPVFRDILVQNLQTIVVDVLLIDQLDVPGRPVIAL